MKMMTFIALWLCFRGPRDSNMRSKCVQNGEKGAAKKKTIKKVASRRAQDPKKKGPIILEREIIGPKGPQRH